MKNIIVFALVLTAAMTAESCIPLTIGCVALALVLSHVKTASSSR